MEPFTPEQLQYLEGRIAQLQSVQGPSHPAPPPASMPSHNSQGSPQPLRSTVPLPIFDPGPPVDIARSSFTIELNLSPTVPQGPPSASALSFDPAARFPAKVVTRIENLEFVEMSDLLQESWCVADSTEWNPMFRQHSQRAPITDILIWGECFAAMAAVLSRKYPSKSSELFAYQCRIFHVARYGSSYPYTNDLCRLQHVTPSGPFVGSVARLMLFASIIVEGLCLGFRIGFDRSSPLQSVGRNMPSTSEQVAAVSSYVDTELWKGRFIGPFDATGATGVHISRIGAVPKGHAPRKWRIITDLSYPEGRSVNDGIDPSLCSLSYISVDSVASIAAKLGRGSLLAKIDIESAYRLVPVHPDDRHLLGIQWMGKVYCDGRLPFSLRSSAKLFNAVIIRERGVHHIAHYLDDFVVLGGALRHPNARIASQQWPAPEPTSACL
ncbi:hypothetical protein EMCRGX_G001211 [Ephydatia muelleri]